MVAIQFRWALVCAVSVLQLVAWGILYYAFTTFVRPMEEKLGWSRSTVTGAFSVGLLAMGGSSIVVGRALDAFGPRLLMAGGALVAAAGLVVWGTAESVAALYAAWLLIGVAMAATLYEPAFWLIARWFAEARGRPLAVLTFVAGLASVIFAPLSSVLVERYGWRPTVLAYAAVIATLSPAYAALFRRPPPPPRAEALRSTRNPGGATPEARVGAAPHPLRTPSFWLLVVAFVATSCAIGGVFVHLVPYLEGEGYAPQAAAAAVGAIGLAALPGRLVLMPLGDVVPRGWVVAGIFLVQAAGFGVLLGGSAASVPLFVALFGLGFGAIQPSRAALIAEHFGPHQFGLLNGVAAFGVSLALAAGPAFTGLLYELAGYRQAFAALGALELLAALAALGASHVRPRHISDGREGRIDSKNRID